MAAATPSCQDTDRTSRPRSRRAAAPRRGTVSAGSPTSATTFGSARGDRLACHRGVVGGEPAPAGCPVSRSAISCWVSSSTANPMSKPIRASGGVDDPAGRVVTAVSRPATPARRCGVSLNNAPTRGTSSTRADRTQDHRDERRARYRQTRRGARRGPGGAGCGSSGGLLASTPFGDRASPPSAVPQLPVAAIGGEQLVVSALFGDPAVVEHDDLIGARRWCAAGGR